MRAMRRRLVGVVLSVGVCRADVPVLSDGIASVELTPALAEAEHASSLRGHSEGGTALAQGDGSILSRQLGAEFIVDDQHIDASEPGAAEETVDALQHSLSDDTHAASKAHDESASPDALSDTTFPTIDAPKSTRAPTTPQTTAKAVATTAATTTTAAAKTVTRVAMTTKATVSEPQVLSDSSASSHASKALGTKLESGCAALTGLAESTSPTSPAAKYASEFRVWLRSTQHQGAVAIGAMAVGALFTWDGPLLWQNLFMLSAGIVGAGIACVEGKSFNLATDLVSQGFLAMQAAAFTCLAVHRGFEGFQVLFGGLLGFACAYASGDWARRLDVQVPGTLLMWYSTGSGLGLLIYTSWRRPVLATLAPMVGGFLVASGLGALASRLVVVFTSKDSEAVGPAWLPPADMAWVDAAAAMIGTAWGANLSWQCACAVLAALRHTNVNDRKLVVCFLGSGTIATSILSCTGWSLVGLDASPQPLWSLVGGALWALLLSGAAWRQLGKLDDPDTNAYDRLPVVMGRTMPSVPSALSLPGNETTQKKEKKEEKRVEKSALQTHPTQFRSPSFQTQMPSAFQQSSARQARGISRG
eukprot:TRINITY_DN11610_c0_g1_i1.p1 TRINITY_DN11610_c0_g1~~TRINITY_DN11610_c0_g1_i1.p1  ORF type:complete len:588 (+),score=75.71 TRINITY_DN11610_c0_g1_i1:60-1823(+)